MRAHSTRAPRRELSRGVSALRHTAWHTARIAGRRRRVDAPPLPCSPSQRYPRAARSMQAYSSDGDCRARAPVAQHGSHGTLRRTAPARRVPRVSDKLRHLTDSPPPSPSTNQSAHTHTGTRARAPPQGTVAHACTGRHPRAAPRRARQRTRRVSRTPTSSAFHSTPTPTPTHARARARCGACKPPPSPLPPSPRPPAATHPQPSAPAALPAAVFFFFFRVAPPRARAAPPARRRRGCRDRSRIEARGVGARRRAAAIEPNV